jgi:signal transduction histidine kinase
VLADPVLLTRILRNLLTNALLHSRGRHVRLLARRRARVEMIVIDNGVGISPEGVETLFLPYRGAWRWCANMPPGRGLW